jgi:hypothetical protein
MELFGIILWIRNMPADCKHQKFQLIETDHFDARRGYKRCSIPGVGYTSPVDPMSPFRPIPVTADFWRNKTGGLVVRFSSNQPYVFHFEALLASGKAVPEEDLEEFAEYVSEVLYDWGGADDPPDPEFSFSP